MTDPKALIAEARELLTSDGLGEHFPYAFSLITRLAAALEEATVPFMRRAPDPTRPD